MAPAENYTQKNLCLCSLVQDEAADVEHSATDAENVAENDAENDDYDDEENEELEDNGMVEKTFKFNDFAKRLLNPKIVRACTVVLTDWEQIPTKSLKAAVTILYRIAYGCSCPAMLYQATLFRIFQHVFAAPREAHQEELRRLGVFVVRKFVETAPSNPKIFAELLFYKSVKDANELESGYCDAYEAGTKGTWTEEQETELRFLFEENQRNPESEKDVIDWILENLIDKTRTRRGVLKKLKELGLMFKAPTKKSSANAAAGKNLWRAEEDEELRSLYDQYRTEEDCLQRILNEFEERRNKQQIIKRMLQLHIIADKSEILPKKKRQRKSKKERQQNNDDSDDMEEPDFGTAGKSAAKSKSSSKPKHSAKAKPRKIVRTPLDVGTVRALISEVDAEKYQDAIDWLRECLTDAAEDIEEPSEEDDGVPLLPLLAVQKDALEDAAFMKVLVALGMQPAIAGMENYWRIPIYLNAADLQLRAKILAREEVEVDVADIEELSDEQNSDDDSDSNKASTNGNSSEEDYFDDYLQRQRKHLDGMENYMNERQQKLDSLMFSKSDAEDEHREPIKEKQPKRKPRQKKQSQESDSDSDADIDDIKNKLDRKQKNRQQGKVSTDEESEVEPVEQKKTRNKSKPAETAAPPPTATAEKLFNELKIKRASKMKLADMVAEVKDTSIEQSDALNFNSEDYRQRLLELGDSDDDTNEPEADENDDNKTLTDANTNRNRSRRANVIDSDSDAEEYGNDKDKQHYGAEVVPSDSNTGDDVVDKTSNQAIDGPTTSTATHNKKRLRSDDANAGDDDYDVGVNNDVNSDDEDALFIKRKKPSKEEQQRAATGEEPAKRRRIAIIDDEDEDDY